MDAVRENVPGPDALAARIRELHRRQAEMQTELDRLTDEWLQIAGADHVARRVDQRAIVAVSVTVAVVVVLMLLTPRPYWPAWIFAGILIAQAAFWRWVRLRHRARRARRVEQAEAVGRPSILEALETIRSYLANEPADRDDAAGRP